ATSSDKVLTHSNGLSTFTPALLKSRVFRVAMVRVVNCFGAVHGPEPAFGRTRQQQFYQAFIARPLFPLEQVLAAIEPFDLELLASFNAILLPDFARQHNLTF